MYETEITIREIIKNKIEKIKPKIMVSLPESGICNCENKIAKFSSAPDWLGDLSCSCGKPTVPSKFFSSRKTVLVEINNQEPKPICDDCRLNLNENMCKHQFIEIEELHETGPIQWRGTLEMSFDGEKYFFVSGNKVMPYLPYIAEPDCLNKKFLEFIDKLHEGNPVSFKGYYLKKPLQELHVNVSSF